MKFIDEIHVDVPGRSALASLFVDPDADYLEDHFPGAPMLPLSKGASGGELSRVMLAIEVVFAGADPVPTFVFDEVDAGVGGKAAVEVGRRLASREVGGLGPGAHVVRFATPGRLAPGVYVARLTRAGRSLSARIAVIR